MEEERGGAVLFYEGYSAAVSAAADELKLIEKKSLLLRFEETI